MSELVKLDSRGRVSLGKYGDHAYYLMEVDEADGRITLTPAVVLTIHDMDRLVRQPDGEQQ